MNLIMDIIQITVHNVQNKTININLIGHPITIDSINKNYWMALS